MRKAFVWCAAAAFAALTLSPAQPAVAASRHAKTHHAKVFHHQNRKKVRVARVPARPTDPSKDAALVIDGRTGATLYARNDDALRHPASLTKMMTLYLLFDALKQGKVTMDTPLKVSAHATRANPTKLYLKKGETIPVETAIKAIVVLSANDVAVTIAENLGGTESKFADMMTAKAHQLGMKNTNYNNASGLPDPGQITTADDLAILARHVAYDFPQYFHYFSTVSFSWHGTPHITHNNLIGNYEGADGINIPLTAAGDDAAQRGQRVGRRVGHHPGEWRGHANGLPAAIGLDGMRVFPLIELQLCRDGFDGNTDFGPEIEGFNRDVCVQFPEVSEVAIGAGHGFLAGRFDVVTEEPPGAE